MVGVGDGGGDCGRGVEVGVAPACGGDGFGGGDTELPEEGMRSSVPMLIIVLVIPLASMIACEVVPKRIAMLLSVSPAWTT